MLVENLSFSVSSARLLVDVPRIINTQGMEHRPERKNFAFSTATAFFYRRGGMNFIGTNEHVLDAVFSEPRPWTDSPVTVRAHSICVMIYRAGAWNTFTVSLRNPNGQNRWRAVAGDADLALLPFDPPPDAQIHPWTAADILPDSYVLELAEPIISLGYPLGFHDHVNNRPIVRRGSMASEYGVNFKGQRYYLTDIKHFPGNSGSPVVTRPKQVWQQKDGQADVDLGAWHCLLTGIHSKREHVAGVTQQAIDLGLGVTWYAMLIEELAAMF